MLLAGARAGSALDPQHTLTQYSHRIWGIDQGLAQPTIYSILQTRSGYLWLGTQDSLVRFDGVRFRQVDDIYGNPLQHNLVRALAEDRAGNLWIGSLDAGLLRLGVDGSLARFGFSQGLPSQSISCLANDRSGALWICTDEGLARYRDGVLKVFTSADGLRNNQPRAWCEAVDGSSWIAFRNGGLEQFKDGIFRPFEPGRKDLQPVQTLLCAHDGTVWAGAEDGLFQIAGGTVHRFGTAEGLASEWISSLAEAADGSIWAGTRNGFSRLAADSRRARFTSFTPRNGLSHSTVLALYFDREGSLWAGTKNGLDQFTDSNITPYTEAEGLPSSRTGPVIEDRSGTLWVGTLGEGLSRFDHGRFQTLSKKQGLAGNTVLSLEDGPDGDLWAGTNDGVSRLHNGRVVCNYGRRQGLSGSQVSALFADNAGTLWAATENGVDRFDGERFVPAAIPGGQRISGIVALAGGHRTRLFVSAEPNSLYQLKDGIFTHHILDGVTRPVTSYYFLDHAKHIVWMGTLGSGLLRWQNGSITHVSLREGLYDNRIYSILPDDHGNLWLASSKGIFRVASADLEALAAGRAHHIASLPFTTGALRFECRAGVQPSAWRDRSGRLWFSTTDGLVAIDPDHLLTTRMAPPVAISSIFVNGQRAGTALRAALRPSQKNLEIRYTALSFVSPEKVTFRYMLEGFDKTWTEAGTRREAFYTNLPPGRFRFRVSARNADGIGSSEDASVEFGIAPLLYQRAWFWPLIVTLGVAFGAALYRLRVRRLRSEFNLVMAERGRIARELHDTLLQGLAGVSMQLQALWTRLPRSREKDTLAEIIADASRCSADVRRSLFGLRVSDGHPDGFSSDLTRFARQTAAGSSTDLILEIDRLSLRSVPDLRFHLMRIAQEAISNAVRHARARTLRIALSLQGHRLELAIEDDGEGFDPDVPCHDHYGLAGMRERATEIAATLRIESASGLGTRILISVPLRSGGFSLKRRVTAPGDEAGRNTRGQRSRV